MWAVGRLILAGLVRQGLVFLSAWLIARGVLTPEQDFGADASLVSEIVGAILLVATSAWMAWAKVREKRLSNTQAAMPAGTTEHEAKVMVKQQYYASALTPAHVAPVIVDNSKPEAM